MKKTLLCIAVGSACGAVYAADDTFQLGIIEVVEKDVNIGTAVIEQSQMQQNQITNVAQAAKITSGVFFERKGGRAEQNILLRGFDSTRVPVFIDGIPVYVPYDGNMDLGRFTTFELAQIDISKGTSSVLYGPNTLGGAINLVSRKPTKALEGSVGYGFQTGRSSHTATNRSYFNLGTKQESFYAQMSGSFLEKQGLQLSRHYQSNTQIGDEDGGRAENSVNRDKKFSLKAAYTPNETDEYALSFATQRAKKDQPFYAGNSVYAVPKYWRWSAWDKDSVYFLSHTEFTGGKYYLNSKAFYDRFKNDLDAYDDNTLSTQNARSAFSSHYRDYSYGGGLEFGANLTEKNNLKLSALYKFDVHKENNDGEPVARSEDRTYSLGVEDSYRFTDRTNIVIGFSADRREALKSQNYQSDINGLYDYDVADKNALNYQIKLNHSFAENNGIILSYARKTRFATMKDRYSRSINRYRTPNPFLKPERADHYEIGYFRTFGDRFKAEGALFYSEVKDAVNEVKTGNSKIITRRGRTQRIYETMNRNSGTETYKGAELVMTAFVSDSLTLGANYTYIWAKNKDRSIVVEDVPKHKFFAYADWKIIPALTFYISQSLETGRFSSNGNDYVRLPGFGVTEAKLSYEINKNINIDAGISNIFDKNYFYTEGYPEEGRLYFANLRYSF